MENIERKIDIENVTHSLVHLAADDGGFDYTADVWTINIPRMDETYTVDFNNRFGELNVWQKQVAKAYIYSICQHSENSIAYAHALGTFRGKVTGLAGIFANLNTFGQTTVFGNIDDFEAVKLVALDENKYLLAKGTIEARVIVWNGIYDLQFSVQNPVDKTLLPARKIPKDWEKICVEHFAPEEFDTSEWLAGGSFDNVPFEVSLALLCYCVETLKSDKTKYLLAWSNWQRDYQTEKVTSHCSKNLLSGFGQNNYSSRQALSAQIDAEYFECLKRYYPDAKTHSDLPYASSNEGSIPFNFDQRSGNGFIINVRHLITTCYVALLILAGARRSEIESIRTDGIKKKGDYYIFHSSIEKTHHGVEKPRTIGSFLIPEILLILDQISVEGLDSDNRELLFGYALKPTSTNDTPRIRNPKHMTSHLNDFYERFLQTDGQHLREVCSHINAHGFRHTWVEFALRRFDGNVMPLIMDRLAHSGQHTLTFTPAYTDNKIDKSEYKRLGKEWMFDIIKRYVSDPDAHAVFGAVGDKIRALVDDMKILDLQNEHERDERAREATDILFPNNIFKPSMTTICCLNEDRQRNAQCYNSKTGVAMTSLAKPSQCAACENGLLCQAQVAQFELTLQEYEERYQQHQLGALANKLRADANEDNPFGATFAEAARKDFAAMQALKKKIDKIRGAK